MLVVAISGGDVVATSVVAKSAPSIYPKTLWPPDSTQGQVCFGVSRGMIAMKVPLVQVDHFSTSFGE